MKGPIPNLRGHILTVVAGLVLAASALGFYLLVGDTGPGKGGTYELKAVAPTAAALAPGARVTVAGVDVGRVTAVSRRGIAALIEMQIDSEDVTPLPRDSRLTVRQRTPIGENYVSIEPGASRADVPSGDVLPLRQADEYVDVDEILSVFQGRTRQQARKLLQGSGEALRGRGRSLNRILSSFSEISPAGLDVVRTLDDDAVDLGALVDHLGTIAATVGERGDDIRGLARDGRTTFRAIAQRDAALRRLLATLPPTLRQARVTSGTLGSVADTATPVLRDVASTTDHLREAVTTLGPGAKQGRAVVRELGRAAPGLETTLTEARRLAGPATTTLPLLRQALCEVGPMARYLGPYAQDLTAMLSGMGSYANAYDALGHVVRVNAVVDDNTLFGLPPEVSRATHVLLRSGLLSKAAGELNYDPYPGPGQIGKTSAKGKAGVVGPEGVRKSGFTYPRVLPDC